MPGTALGTWKYNNIPTFRRTTFQMRPGTSNQQMNNMISDSGMTSKTNLRSDTACKSWWCVELAINSSSRRTLQGKVFSQN